MQNLSSPPKAFITQDMISLSDVAGKILISKNYLCDLFKKELNVTFIDYVTNLRIEKAKQLLSGSDMTALLRNLCKAVLAFRQLCAPLCGRFDHNEGGVAGLVLRGYQA